MDVRARVFKVGNIIHIHVCQSLYRLSRAAIFDLREKSHMKIICSRYAGHNETILRMCGPKRCPKLSVLSCSRSFSLFLIYSVSLSLSFSPSFSPGRCQFGESKLSVNLATTPQVNLAKFSWGQSICLIHQSTRWDEPLKLTKTKTKITSWWGWGGFTKTQKGDA